MLQNVKIKYDSLTCQAHNLIIRV
uniref:Uncharacterized protein n=1 Tax=Anguilla anguilla TaxID=7936 RepID=A0A0E9PMX5_ANGAN